MSKRPPDGEYTRRSDVKNKKLTPGERAINWAKAATTAWPVVLGLVGLLGYTNVDEIKQFYQKTELAEVDGETEIDALPPAADPFRAQVKKFSEEVRKELEEIKTTSHAIRSQLDSQDRKNFEALVTQIGEIDKRLIDIEEIVQP